MSRESITSTCRGNATEWRKRALKAEAKLRRANNRIEHLSRTNQHLTEELNRRRRR